MSDQQIQEPGGSERQTIPPSPAEDLEERIVSRIAEIISRSDREKHIALNQIFEGQRQINERLSNLVERVERLEDLRAVEKRERDEHFQGLFKEFDSVRRLVARIASDQLEINSRMNAVETTLAELSHAKSVLEALKNIAETLKVIADLKRLTDAKDAKELTDAKENG